jgi:hypothetical protein
MLFCGTKAMNQNDPPDRDTAYTGFDRTNRFGVVILCNYEDANILLMGDEVLAAIHDHESARCPV